MMNTKLQNVMNLFRNTRTRTVILLTFGILLFTVLIGLIRFSRGINPGPNAEARLNTIQQIQSIPGGLKTPPSAEYQALQERQNILQAQQAQETGHSAIPTIVESSMLRPPNASSPCCCTPCDPSGVPMTTISSKRLISGTPIYDAKGRLIGTVGEDGKIKTDLPPGTLLYDGAGRLIGTIGADGTLQTYLSPGTPLYDEQGNLLGILNEAGKVCNALSPGASLYDAQGKLIETVLADGSLQNNTPAETSIYDEQGQWVGVLGEGTLCRDLPPGTVLYDAQGSQIGSVGADGVIRGKVEPGTPIYDENGQIIGHLGPDGKIRGNLPPGTPIYDTEGRRVGTIGPNGEIRPFVVDEPVSPSESSGLSLNKDRDPALQAILERQAAQMSEQETRLRIQELQGAMSNQVGQLLNAWITIPNQQVVMGEEGVKPASGVKEAEDSAIAVKAGTIMYAVLETAVNSDEPGPVLARIIEGPFKGGRLLGRLALLGERVQLTFDMLSLPKISRTIKISTIAIDHETARTALSNYTDRHILLRYGSLMASSFLDGYAKAVQKSGTRVKDPGGGMPGSTEYPNLSTTDKLLVALGTTGAQVGAQLSGQFNTPPTVHVYQGAPIGILFTQDLAKTEFPQKD